MKKSDLKDIIEEDFSNDYYECNIIPKNANQDNKTGITLKSNEGDFIRAQQMIMETINKKGDRFLIRNVEIGVVDTPKNKPICVEIKTKNEMSGKANLRFYSANKKGIATIMID